MNLDGFASKRACIAAKHLSSGWIQLDETRSFAMDIFSAPWWSALAAIILIDLVLAGDNAIVIALAARSLPAHLQRKAIVWVTVGAIAVRATMTVGVVWLLRVPGLMLAGGIGLL